MNNAQRDALTSYFGDLANRLGAPGWEVEVGTVPAGDGDEAGVFLRDNEDRATLHVPDGFFAVAPAKQRRTLVHEALHLVLDRACRAYEDAIDDLTPVGFDRALRQTPRRLHERGIETLARQLAEFMPLPTLPKEASDGDQ